MKSLLYQTGATPLTEALDCRGVPCRQEVQLAIKKGGRIYRFTLRDRIVPEDPYLVLVKAAAFAIQTGEPYAASTPLRSIRDALIKQELVI